MIFEEDGSLRCIDGVIFDTTLQHELQQSLQEALIQTKKYAKELEESQIELRGRMRALNNAGMVTETDLQGNITYVSDETLAVWGYTREEVLGKPHNIIKSDEHPEAFFKEMWETIQKGNVWKGEVKNRAKDGSEFWVMLSITPVLDKEGKPVKYIGVAFDITAQKRQSLRIRQMLKESREQEKQLRKLTEELQKTQLELTGRINALNNAAIVSETDLEGNIIFVNDEATYVWGYSREELIGKPHSIIKSDHHKPSFFKRMWEKISAGYVWHGQVKNRAKDGSYFWVKLTITPVVDAEGKPMKYIGVAFDITNQKRQAERIKQALKEAEAKEAYYKAEIERLKRQAIAPTPQNFLWLDTHFNIIAFHLSQDSIPVPYPQEPFSSYISIESDTDAFAELSKAIDERRYWEGTLILRDGKRYPCCYIPILRQYSLFIVDAPSVVLHPLHFALDKEGKITMATEAFSHFFGFDEPGHMINEPIHRWIIQPNVLPLRSLNGAITLPVQGKKENGKTFYAILFATPMKDEFSEQRYWDSYLLVLPSIQSNEELEALRKENLELKAELERIQKELRELTQLI